MTFDQWKFLASAAISLALVVGPWMFKVHAKLAVIASKIVDLCDKLEQVTADRQRLWETCARHESRLDTHDVQISHISQRLDWD